VICMLAMGPRLEFAGRFVIGLPGSALARLPLLDKALPARFMLYAYLVAAVMVAAWQAEDRGQDRARKQLRWALGLAIVPFMLHQLSPQALAPYRNLTAIAMEQRAERARFEALLLGAERYLDAGGDLASLSPERAQQLGLLPQGWFGGAFLGTGDSNPIFHSAVALGPGAPDGIAVGIEGQPDALASIIRSYRADATRIYFPYPAPFVAGAAPQGPAIVVLTFDRAGLARAAASTAPAPAR
jgi:hypothetical protein